MFYLMGRFQVGSGSEGLYKVPNKYEIAIFSEKDLLVPFGALAKRDSHASEAVRKPES
ncbi:MAG: hypothetical protein OQJ89_12565 [Kangiellaceae bacterium]|nr:hypothetical protein [Kangiellaceae bacterium]MCW9017795.1 hypothetical protein [Kangiellaceae bacterium]